MSRRIQLLMLVAALLLAACGDGGLLAESPPLAPTQAETASTVVASPAVVQSEATATNTALPPTPTPVASATTVPPSPTPIPVATQTPTPDPYAGLTIADLAAREYGEGSLQVLETIHVTDAFTRTLVSYPSEGFTVSGFLNVPFGQGPFPVALVLHGYIPPENYGTIGYTTRYADWLARAGYVVFHPNYRSHPPLESEAALVEASEGPEFRVDYAVDVMNLMAIIERMAGQPGPLAQADAQQMHLLGHSMGGGIALRISTVQPDVDAIALYGSMSGDERQNYERVMMWSDGESGAEELATPQEDLQRISPIYHLERIQAAVTIHHGELDDTVPPEWSTDLCERLQALNKTVECYRYPDQPHTFRDAGDQLFIGRVIDFFNRH
ncbi:MAG: prolyl oligopeptidase family serine peptidase [Chloroflexota bacterium]